MGDQPLDLGILHSECVAKQCKKTAIRLWHRTAPSAITTSFSSVMRVMVIVGLPTNASFSVSLSNASLPTKWNAQAFPIPSARQDKI
jgi:hypothetical protein